MRRGGIVRGKTTEEQMKSIDVALTQLNRRTGKFVIGAIPPMIYMNFTSDPVVTNGDLLKCIFPIGSNILRGVFYVEEYTAKELVDFVAELKKLDGSTWSQKISTRATFANILLNQQVLPGDRLTFKVMTPESVKGVWVGFLCEVPFQDLTKYNYAIQRFEELVDAQSTTREAEEAGEEEGSQG